MLLPIALGIFFAVVVLCIVLLAKALKADRATYDRARGVTPDAFPPPPTRSYTYTPYATTEVGPVVVERDDEPLIDALTIIAEVAVIDALADQPIYDPPTDYSTPDLPPFDGGASGGGGGGSDW